MASPGAFHTVAIKLDGTLWAWGNNGWGQLGDGTFENRNFPVMIGSGFVSISAGYKHSLAIKTDNTLWAWGNNEFGQLGDGTFDTRNIPVKIGSDYEAIAAGGKGEHSDICHIDHSIGLKIDGTLWAWGNNTYGQLGNGSNVDQNIPVQIGGN